MSKRISILFIFMLLFQTITSSLALPAQILAAGTDDSIIRNVTVVDKDGEVLDGESLSEIDESTEVNVVVDWSVEGLEIEGDITEPINLPSNVKISENQKDSLYDVETEVGMYEVSDTGTITFSFNEAIVERPDGNGTFVIEAKVEVVEEKKDTSKTAEEEIENVDTNSNPNTEDGKEKGTKDTEIETEFALANQENNDREPGLIEENIIDAIKLVRADGSEYQEGEFLDQDEKLSLALEWSLPEDPVYVAGDTFEFQLPEQLAIYNELTGDLDDYGTYVVTTGGKVTFTFNEQIEDNSNVWGTFWVNTELDVQHIETTTEELEFVMSDGEVEKITINIKPEGGQAIQKNGQPVDGNFNTKEIEWTVVINTTRESLENAILNDPILAGQELILDSIDVEEVEVNLQGGVVGVVDGDVSFENKSTVEELELHFGDTNKAYRITFRTEMKEEEEDNEGWTTYENTAYLNSDGKDQAQNGASVSVQRPESLTKTSSAFDKEDRSVEWTVNANFTEKELSAGTEIVDEFTFTIGDVDRSDAFEITLDDIEIVQVDSFGENGAVGETSDAKDLFNIVIVDNKVTYTLEEDSNKAFVIKYKTTAKDGAYINDDGTISNTVGIDGKTATSGQGVYQQVGVKTNDGINYEDKTIDWTITVNADSQALNGFVLTDDFSGSGQQLVAGSIEISPDAPAGTTISPDDGGEGFVIDFGDISQSYTITYQTEFTYDFGDTNEKPSFKNGVNVSYTTTEGTEYELEFGDNVNPNEETRSNGAKNNTVNQDTKEITWFIDINYNQLHLEDASLIDEIADNQSLVEGSLEIYPTTIAENGAINEDENEVTDFNVVEASENRIEINFGKINQSYRVYFKTVDKDDIYNSDEVYTNTAQFLPRKGEVHKLPSNATLPNQGEFLGKSGLHNKEDWTIDWEIIVNNSKSKLNGVTVTDDLGDDGSQILLEDSIVVTKVGSEDPLPEDAYTVEVDGNTFEVTLIGEITDTYSITYSSYILAEETANLTNEAEIKTVEETIVGSVESTDTVEVRISTGGGTAEGATGELVLQKLETDTNRPLEGIAFTLTREVFDQTIVVREGTTDENGEIHWTGLRYGTYTLEEDIPEGYLGKASQEITINDETTEEGVLTLQEEIANERQKGIAAIKKIDSVTGEGLGGAVFEITNLVTDQTYTLTTEDDGIVSEEVPFGEYTVEEVTAPNGYRLASDLDNITIEVDETTTVEIANEAITEISVSKVWDDEDNQDGIRSNSVTVNLLGDSEIVRSVVLDDDNEWRHTFNNLPVYNEEGQEITYKLTEDAVSGYTHSIDPVENTENAYVVTNSHTPDQTEVNVTKVWEDSNNQDGNRPGEIQVQLLADGEPHGDVITLNAGMDWTYTWTALDKNADGEAIVYTIEEIDAPEGYEVSTNNEDHSNLVITNSYEPATTEIAVSKAWDDVDNQDDARPNNVTINLLADGKVAGQTVLNEGNDWSDTFTNLPVYNNGEEINYTVTENTVSGYSTNVVETITDDGTTEFVITNSRTPEETSVTVTKAWEDSNNQDGNRPTSIQVQLFADGEEQGEPVTLTTGYWTYTWTGLDANADGAAVEYTVEELNVLEDYEVTVNDTDHGNIMITNSYEPETTEITVNKAWEDENNQDGLRPNNVTVNLLANGEIARQTVLNEDNKWQHTFTDLPVNKNGVAIKYTVTENTVPDYSTEIDEFSITNTHTPEQTSVTVNKAWDDANNQDGIRSESVELQLTANGEDVGEPVELNAANYWTYTWDELDLNAEGEAIKYSVRELNVPEGYEVRVNDNDHGNIIVTNSYAPAVTEVSVSKTWDDEEDRDRIRPGNVTVNLLADFEIVRQVVLSEANNWEHIFRNLPVYNNGVEIEYSITENTVANYSTSIDEFDITNFYTPEKTTATVSKSWDDSNDQDGIRPETIEVQLYANDVPYGDSVELMTDNWTYTWDDLPLNDAGEPIVYTVQEVEVPEGYEVSYNINDHGNLIITNYHEPAVTEVDVSKIWDDANDQDGIRPEVIAINLFANGELVESKEISAEDNWEHTFTDLPKYVAGVEIVYTIEEESVEGYETSIDEENTVTNSHTPEVLTISGTKTWNDANNQDGIRPESITVNLLADGTQIADITVTEEDGWVYEFTDLPKYRDGGIEIIYTITEDSVNEYTTEIDGYNVTNHYTPGETSVTVTKHWDDADNQDGIRPGSIEVQLTGDGEAVGETVELSAENNWTQTWTELDEKAAGQTIIYSVVEVTELPKYETIINDENQGNIMITNSYTPETTEVIGTKTWNDADNQDGIRPETITVNLYANGEATDSIEVTVEENWSYQFNDLPKYEAGEEIIYTVTEDAVEGYEPSIDGTDITNTHIPEVIDVNGTKIWNDANNQDGVRPESITVNLYADGEAIDSVEVTAEDNWNYSFDNLPKYEAGEEIVYTITEDDVENYETTINGFNITNSYTPETTEITGTKSWNDADNQDAIRPESITVNLLANGEKVAEAEVTAADDWNYSFVDVPKYENGKEITYTVTENAVESYTPEYNGFDITNHYTPGETAVTVTKHWDDATNQDGIRPESIEVQLIANGEAIGDAIVLSEANDWTHTWTELAEKADGTTIVYTVEEITNLPAYEVTVDDENHGNIIITNAYTPEEIEITGTKTWKDNNNEAGNRPTSITVNLYADGVLSKTMTVSEEDNWNFSFTNLPKYNNGEEIEYTITENPVTGYETTINGFDITNTLIDEVESENAMVDADTDEQDGTGGTLTDSAGEANQLPKTATNMYNLLAIGLGILILGIAIALYQRRRQTN